MAWPRKGEAMKFAGTLHLWVDDAADRLHLKWDPSDGTTHPEHSCSIANGYDRGIGLPLLGPGGAWDTVIHFTAIDQWAGAWNIVRQMQTDLNVALPGVCEFLLNGLTGAAPGDVVCVSQQPSDFPIELLPVGGEPFAVRYKVLHQRPDRAPGVRRPAAQRGDAPRTAFGGVFPDDLSHPHCTGEAHCGTVADTLKSLFPGPSQTHPNVFLWHGPDASAHRMRTHLRRAPADCLYLLCHNVWPYGGKKGLKLSDGDLGKETIILDAETITVELETCPRRGGFAFLNACCTAVSPGKQALDIALAFLRGGYDAVLGTVLSPLGDGAAVLAERFFHNLLPNSMDLLETLHQLRRESWERIKGGNAPAHLAWPCYRLYAARDRRFLCTGFSHSDGRVEISPANWGTLALGRLGGGGSGEAVTPAQLEILVAKYPACVAEAGSLVAFLRQLFGNRKVASLGAAAVHDILCNRPELAGELLEEDAQHVLEAVRRKVHLQEPGSTSPFLMHFLAALVEFQRTKATPVIPPPQHGKQRISPPDIGTAALVWHAIQDSPHGQPASLPGLFKAPALGIVFDKPFSEVVEDREAAPLLCMARAFALFAGSDQVETVHLFEAVVTMAVLFDSAARGNTLTDAFISQISELPKKSDVSPAVLRHIQLGLFIKHVPSPVRWFFAPPNEAPRRPLCFNVLQMLCVGGDLDHTRSVGMSPLALWKMIQGGLAQQDAFVAMPTSCFNGIVAGSQSGAWPKSAQSAWGDKLIEAAWVFAEHEAPLVLAVPWEPAVSNPLRSYTDAVCSNLRRLVQNQSKRGMDPEKETDAHRRHWIILDAEKLERPIENPVFAWVQAMAQRRAPRRKILQEAKNDGVLCVIVPSRLLKERGKEEQYQLACRLFRTIIADVPACVIVPSAHWWETAWSEAGFVPVALDPLDDPALARFLLQWRSTPPRAGAMSLNDDLANHTLQTVKRARITVNRDLSKEERLDLCMEILEHAERQAAGNNEHSLSMARIDLAAQAVLARHGYPSANLGAT